MCLCPGPILGLSHCIHICRVSDCKERDSVYPACRSLPKEGRLSRWPSRKGGVKAIISLILRLPGDPQLSDLCPRPPRWAERLLL